MAVPCTKFNEEKEKFVDRTLEMEFLVSFVSTDRGKSKKNRIIHLVGNSGVGKSSLICKCHDYLNSIAKDKVKSLIISFKDHSNFQKKEEFIFQTINFLSNQINPQKKDEQLINISKSKKIDDISSKFVSQIGSLQNEFHVVFLLDEVDILDQDQISALEDNMLFRCLEANQNVVVIFAGRKPISGLKDFDFRPRNGLRKNFDLSELKENANVVELLRFDIENTKKQLEASKKTQDMKFAARMHKITGGSPGNNRKIIDKITSDPPQLDELEAVRTCNEELYAELKVAGQQLPRTLAAELLPALEALCILQDFDKEYEAPILLAAHTGLSGVWDLKRSSELLNVMCNIYIGPGLLMDWNGDAYAIEDQVRFNLEQELKIGNPVLWKKLHCTAMKMYADWAKEYNSDIFETKSEYHRTVLSDAGFGPETCQEG